MIIGSVDLRDGQVVQLVQGKTLAVQAGAPEPWVDTFARVGEVAVIDLDAAMGTGDNAALVRRCIVRAPCRVGGGIRTVSQALHWLEAGASRVILGTAATPDILSKLPAARVIAALDTFNGEVVVKGWRQGTGQTLAQRLEPLRGLVGGVMVTFVEREGKLAGIDLTQVKEVIDTIRQLCGQQVEVTVAGGVTTADQVAQIHAMGAHAQVGMALYTQKLTLGQCLAGLLSCDRADGLWPTAVSCAHSGRFLGLAYSSHESLEQALETGQGVYCSRKRGVWRKGQTSGCVQKLARVRVDCDADTLLFEVEQAGAGFCHLGSQTCFDTASSWQFGLTRGLAALESRIAHSAADNPATGAYSGPARSSYTRKLLSEPKFLHAKLREEADELTQAKNASEALHEVADLFYFALVHMRMHGVALHQVERLLDARAQSIHRRQGAAKPDYL